MRHYAAAILFLTFCAAPAAAAGPDKAMETRLLHAKAALFREYCADAKAHEQTCEAALSGIDTSVVLRAAGGSGECVFPDNADGTTYPAAVAWIVRHREFDGRPLADAEQAMLRALWNCPGL